MSKFVQLQSGDWILEIDPTGGAIRHARWRGRDILRPWRDHWDIFPAVCNASFALVPYSNRIRDGRFFFGDCAYSVPSFRPGDSHGLHGVGWLANWDIDKVCEDCVRLTYRHQGPQWPWIFGLEQRIRIDGDRLAFAMTFINTDTRPQPVGLGFHPYFPRDEDTRLTFKSKAVWYGEIAGLSEYLIDLPERWQFENGRTLTEEQIDHCFTGWPGSARIDWPSRGLSVQIKADQPLNHVVVFTPTGEPYLCFEPVSHMSNGIHHLDGETDTGLKVLQPGETIHVSMTLMPSLS